MPDYVTIWEAKTASEDVSDKPVVLRLGGLPNAATRVKVVVARKDRHGDAVPLSFMVRPKKDYVHFWAPKDACSISVAVFPLVSPDVLSSFSASIRSISLARMAFTVCLLRPNILIQVLLLLFRKNVKGARYLLGKSYAKIGYARYQDWLTTHNSYIGRGLTAAEVKARPKIVVLVKIGPSDLYERTLRSLHCQLGCDLTILSSETLKHASLLKSADDTFYMTLSAGMCLDQCALSVMAEALSQDHSLVAVYCDEDLMDKRGRRSKPLLKPAWSPPLADSGWLSLEGALIRPSAAFPRFEISDAGIEQLLNAACSRREVLHIPQILLHRAQERPPVPNSKPLQRSTTKPCSVSVIIPTRDHVQLLRVCVNSIPKCASDISTDLIILNNGSSEPCTWQYFEEIKSERAVDVVDAFAPFNFSQLCNLGVRRSPNEHVLLMNNDVEARDTTWLSTMVAELDDPDVGAVGALLVYPDGYIQHGGITLGLGGAVARNSYQFQHPRSRIGRGLLKQRRDVSAVTAACLLTRKSLWDLVGGMDEENLAVAYNDVDYCLKLRQMGKRIVWTPHAVLVHRESVSRGPDRSEEAFRRFVKEETVMRERWGNLLKQDPYYNPNLSLTVEASMLEPFPISLAARRS